MIRAFLLGCLLISSSVAYACPMADAAEFAEKAKAVEKTKGKKASFVLVGMTCGSCSSKVYGALEKMEGVLASAVDYQSGRVEIAFNAKKTTVKKLKKALEATGYKLKNS